jgi:hypothetical protein
MFVSLIPWLASVAAVAVIIALRWMVVDLLLDSFGAPPGAGGWPPPRNTEGVTT